MKRKTGYRLLIQSPQTAADLQKICGTQLPEGALLIENGSSVTVVVSEMEINRMRRSVGKNIKAVCPQEIGSAWSKGAVDWIEKIISVKKLEVTYGLPFGLAQRLIEQGFELILCKDAVCPEREIKTDNEVQSITLSQRAAVAAMNAAIAQISSAEIGSDQLLRIGKTLLTSEAVRATIGHTLLDHECIAEETIVSCGKASADPHERGEGPLRAGEPIVMDIFPRSAKTGYWGDLTRTVCRGSASPALKKQYNAVKAAQSAQLKAVKQGVGADWIHKIGADLMAERGFLTETIDGVPQGFTHGTGHGVGLEIHEAPRVSPANQQKLSAGHVITIEPGLYYPQTGGVRIEDTILVTSDGYKMFAPCPKTLEV